MIVAVAIVVGLTACAVDLDATGAEEGGTSSEPAATYTIQYTVGEQTLSYSGTEQSVALKSLADLGITLPEGKTMDGWMQSGTTITVAVGSVVTLNAGEPTTFVAQLSDTKYTVTFVSDGKVIDSKDYVHGSTVTAPADPEKEGFVFMGWSPSVVETAGADATYTAEWREIFDITWVVDGVQVATGTTEGETTMAIPSDPKKDAFAFEGWFDDHGARFDDSYEFKGDTVLTAQFRANTYTVTFVYGEEETVLGTVTVKHGDVVMAPELPSGFVGWAYDFKTPVTGDMTVKAIPSEPDEGMSTGTQITLYIAGVIVVILLFFLAYGWKTGKLQKAIATKKRKG